MRHFQSIALLLSISAGFSASPLAAQELYLGDQLQLHPPASESSTPVQKVAFNALHSGSSNSSAAAPLNVRIGDQQPAQLDFTTPATNQTSTFQAAPSTFQPINPPRYIPASTLKTIGTGTRTSIGDQSQSLQATSSTFSDAVGIPPTVTLAPAAIETVGSASDQSITADAVVLLQTPATNSSMIASDSKIAVPPAPPVDTQSDPTGRPLSVPSNAATMPDEFYKKSWCNLGDPVYFVDRPTLRIGGWDQIGWHSQDNGLFNDYRRKINIHQSWGFIEKDFVTAGGTGIKFRGDMMYGIDSRRLQAFGNEPFGTPQDWDNSWDNGTYGFALPQFYSEVALQNATIRAGRFLSPFGFENAAPVENFFYSHTYTYTLSHPHTLSGVVAQGCLNDTTSVFAGGTNGWDTSFNQVGFTGLGGFSKRLQNGGLLTYGTSFGEFGARGNGYFHSIVYAVPVNDKLQFAMQSDWLSAETSDDWGVTGYGIYRFNKCLAAGTRMEYWETDPNAAKQQSAIAWTSGLNYRPHANVVIRPEVRMDWNGAAVAKGDINLGLDFVLTF